VEKEKSDLVREKKEEVEAPENNYKRSVKRAQTFVL